MIVPGTRSSPPNGVLPDDADEARPCECRRRRIERARNVGIKGSLPKRFRGVSFDRPPVSDMARQPGLSATVGAVRRYCETIDEQLAVFDDLSESDQVVLLNETLEVLDQLPEVHERLLEAYLKRDLAELSRLVKEYLQVADSAVEERFKAAVLDARHERMTERMLPFLEKGGRFVAVGALHLMGADGILARLKAAGYDVRRVY